MKIGSTLSKRIPAIAQIRYREALLSRDAQFDGVFYYGVRTTRIYCRPSCPARKPRLEQVVLFTLPEAAKQLGFRACLRCHPDQIPARSSQAQLMQRVCRAIEADLERSQTLSALSAQVNLSPSYLQKTFKRLLGITPRQYAEARRVERFKACIKEGSAVTDAMYEAGYGSSSRLYEKSNAQLGMTPATYRRGGAGMRIKYTIADSPLGLLLVAATARGICSVSLGNSEATLTKGLVSEYSKAKIEHDAATLSNWVKALLSYLNGYQPHLDLPLDVQASAFQKRVWEELRRIPYGRTASYSEIARRIGEPNATRAVARACATNPVALITPCHRAIRKNGQLGGYRWGLERKKALLTQERARRDRLSQEASPS